MTLENCVMKISFRIVTGKRIVSEGLVLFSKSIFEALIMKVCSVISELLSHMCQIHTLNWIFKYFFYFDNFCFLPRNGMEMWQRSETPGHAQPSSQTAEDPHLSHYQSLLIMTTWLSLHLSPGWIVLTLCKFRSKPSVCFHDKCVSSI